MAIDTENKRRNVVNIATSFLMLGLVPVNGIQDDDRENLGEVYIGFDYTQAPAPVVVAVRSRIRHGMGIGF